MPIATAMSLQTGIPAAFVRKKAKEYGTCLAVEGSDVRGKRVVLIEDVITTGGAVADATRLVREAGADVLGVVCAIWRGDGEPAIRALPELAVIAAMTKASLSVTPGSHLIKATQANAPFRKHERFRPGRA